MDVLWWLIVGLAAGAIARLLVPGRYPLGILGTLALGLAGSLLGGFLADVIANDQRGFSPAGLLGSIIGAILLLLVYRAVVRRRRGYLRRA